MGYFENNYDFEVIFISFLNHNWVIRQGGPNTICNIGYTERLSAEAGESKCKKFEVSHLSTPLEMTHIVGETHTVGEDC